MHPAGLAAPEPTVPGRAPEPTVPGRAPEPTAAARAPEPTVPGRASEPTATGRAPMRAVLHAALDAVVAIDGSGRVVEWNPAAERCFGYVAADAVGRELAGLIVPPELRERHRHGLRRHAAGGPAVLTGRRIEITAQRAGGERFPAELTITRTDMDGEPLYVAYVRDIGDRRRAEAELRDSRARIVAAGDAARRRIERDLHDGAQQHLVAIVATLRLARARVDSHPAAARDLLDGAVDALGAATAELRELARGIHPVVLTEGGLAPAVDGLAGRVALPVETDGPPPERLPADVEATAYYVVAEALTNVVRHAAATRATV